MKMKLYNMLVPGMCMAAGVSLLLLATACSKKEKVSLQTATVTRGEITEAVTATGTLECITQVDVGTQVTGIVAKLYADFNSVVTEGQLIAEIDKTTLEADLQSADAQLESARLEYEYAKKNYERDEALHQKQLISDYDYETSRRDYLVAKSDYERMQANRVSAARNLSYAEITSPMDGIVISREVEIGQTVVSNMEVANLFTIGDLDKMQVVADVDEADIGSVKVGQNAQFTVDAFPNDIFQGQVTQVRISPTTDTNVTTYEVLISTTNPDHKLIPGLTANVTIKVMEEKDVLTLPIKVLRFEPMQFANDDIVIELERGRGNIHKSASECEFALTSYNESPSVARLDAVNAPGNALLVKVFLKHKLSGSEQRQLALVHSGSKSFGLSYADRLVFTAENQHMPQLAIITPAGIADDVSPAVFKVQSGNFILAWSVALGAVALLYLLLPVYHAFALPAEERYSGRINSAKEFYREFGSAFVTFFTKKGIVSALLFILFYRFAEAQLLKLGTAFLIDYPEYGGLGLSNSSYGVIYGIFGVISLTAGGILGGWALSKQGLRFWMLPMALALTMPLQNWPQTITVARVMKARIRPHRQSQ